MDNRARIHYMLLHINDTVAVFKSIERYYGIFL